jgi:tetratricopeptide (TPR) repeat protein
MIKRTLAVAFFLCSLSLHAQVRVWQGTLTLPTYEEGLPDPNPPFDQFTTNRFNYPYMLRNNLTSRRVDHNWRAVYLENKYLKCSILPDIGGHLYTCTDKISGKPMFYANPSIKKAAIAYRGAWSAFGIEFNFPVSHNWMTMSPVSYSFGQREDGGASVTVGNVDRVYGMEWSVELVLRPKSTVLEEKVTLSNRSDARHRFYWWNNAGIEAWDDSRIVYPMRFAATHGFTEVHTWPVDDDGVDYSILKNHKKGPVSLFVHGSREGFMGVWNPHTNTGTVHYAEYDQLPAKKIWSWGADADGLDWRKALSDNNSAYLEVQAGLFRNQETYAFLEPRQSIRFSEYWMPVREIGGFARANLAGLANLTRSGNDLVIGLNINQLVPGAVVSVLNGKQSLIHETTDLMPEKAWIRRIPNVAPDAKYTIEIAKKGKVILRQTEGEYDWTPTSEIHVGPQPAHRIPEPDKRTYDDWLQFAKDQELNGRNLSALQTYKEALAKFPESFEAAKAAGRLNAALLRFEEARDLLEPLHPRDTTDTEVSYYLGLAYDGMGDTNNARTSYEQAERLPSYYPAASLRLSELLAQQKNWPEAERHLSGALSVSPGDLRIREELVAVLNASGQSQRARSLAEETLAHPSLSYFLREEMGKVEASQLANDPNRILNVAAQYMRLGLYQKALSVLTRAYPQPAADQSEPGTAAPQQNVMIAYFRAYCSEELGQDASQEYGAASKLSTSFIFPSNAEELIVLRAATKANPSDATAHYLLGTLYFSKGLTAPALSEWALAKNFGPRLPVLDASTGLAYLQVKNDPERALSSFQSGLESDPNNIAIYMGMDQALSLLNRASLERVQALERYPKMENAPPAVIFELILNLAEAGDFERATGLFHNRFFPREEGGTNVRQVWVEVQLQRILSLAKAGQCDAAFDGAQSLGVPVVDLEFTGDGLEPILQSARTNYLLGTLYESCRQPDKAKTAFYTASKGSAPDQVRWAWLAAQKFPGFDPNTWQDRLKTALDQAATRSDTSGYPSWWMYTTGRLALDLGNKQEADLRFRKALLLPDRMLAYHFTRLALPELKPQ